MAIKQDKQLQTTNVASPTTVHGGATSFLLLDSVTSFTAKAMHGSKYFNSAPSYLLLESMAQLGALHLRKSCHFSRHAFLLSIQQSQYIVQQNVTGTASIHAEQIAYTETTATYAITLTLASATSQGCMGSDIKKATKPMAVPTSMAKTAAATEASSASSQAQAPDATNGLLRNSHRPPLHNHASVAHEETTLCNQPHITISGEFTFSSVPYSEKFPEHTLKPRYQKVFQWLTDNR